MMKRILAAIAAAWLLLLMPVWAQSTINTGQPATNSNLNSLVVRQLALAAATDINNILGMHASTSLSQCPSGTSVAVGEDCLTVGSTPYGWYKWTGNAGGWALVATINPSSGLVSIALNSGNIIPNPPIVSNVAGGAATLSLAIDANFAVNGSNQLSLNPGAGNLFLATPSGSSGEPSLRALVGADLPTPSPTTLGGIESLAAVSHQWINAISTGGVPSALQPGFSDLSGSLAPGQCPNATASTTGCVEGDGTTLSIASGVIGLNLSHTNIWQIAQGVQSNSAQAFDVGANGQSNPVLQVDASTASVATGITVKGAAAGSGVNIATISSGTNESLNLNAKNAGGVNIGNSSTGGVTIGNGGGGVEIGSALTYGGVTLSNSVTGTGAMVLGTSPGISGATLNGGSLSGTFSGTPTLSGSNFITLGNIVQDATAYSLLGNATGGTANYAPFTIGGLTQKASPASSDLVMIQDQAASGALKFATVSSIASAGSVASFNGQTGAITFLTEPQGRLTLAANTPVMGPASCGGSCISQSTLRYDCYIGGQVPYYTGSADAYDTISSCEVTDAFVGGAAAGQVVSGQVYDVWWVHGGANRICLAMSSSTGGGGGWASDTGGSNTARGTGYSQLDRVTRPYITNKNPISNCFNNTTNYGPVSANQATYLGTILATGNGQTSFVFGSAASGGGAATFGVWNMYNRVDFGTIVSDTASTWTYATSLVWRAADNSSTIRVNAVRGLDEDAIFTQYNASGSAGASTSMVAGLGLDSTTAFTGTTWLNNFTVQTVGGTAAYNGLMGAGSHFVSAIELNTTTTASTWDGSLGTAYFQSGLHFRSRM